MTKRMYGIPVALGVATIASALYLPPANADNLTSETRKALKMIGEPESAMNGLDAELALPKSLLDAANKEGEVGVRMTMIQRHFVHVQKMFNARYPKIKVKYFRGVGNERALVPLLALKRGKYLSDVVASISVLLTEFHKMNALADISALPAYKNVPLELSGKKGRAVAYRIQNYCLTYATDRVKKEELPKTWDALVADKRWSNGRVGMATNANVWIALFAAKFGNDWAENFMNKMFRDLKPQLRRERLNAISKVAALGEFDMAIPQSDAQARDAQRQGLKIGYHCPDPVAVNGTVMAVLRGSPHENAGKVWVNWMLSREGQLANFAYDFTGPSHTGLRGKPGFSHFPAIVNNTPHAYLNDKALANMPVVMKSWQKKWASFGGPGRGKAKKKQPR